jgi:GTPase SAR1 family protein
MQFSGGQGLLEERNNHLLKIILLGNRGVGKSNLLLRFTRSDFKMNMVPTVGIEFASSHMYLPSKNIMLNL